MQHVPIVHADAVGYVGKQQFNAFIFKARKVLTAVAQGYLIEVAVVHYQAPMSSNPFSTTAVTA